MWKANILTIFPEMFPATLGHSLAGKALEKNIWELNVKNIRDYALGVHKTVDDKPFGGGAGMVMKPDVLGRAIDDTASNTHLIYMSPRGRLFNQRIAEELITKDITIICGRFEGIDQRVIDKYDIDEISIGNFVLSGGEVAALTMLDACVRLLPDVVGGEGGVEEESFGKGEYENLLEYPHYTRPAEWEGLKVPEVLLSGNHGEIEKWRLEQAKEATKKRKDLLNKLSE